MCKTRALLIITPLFVAQMIWLFSGLTGVETALGAMAVYWLTCLALSVYFIGAASLKSLFRRPPLRWQTLLWALLPVALVVFGSFAKDLPYLTPRLLALSAVFALINASSEELFWRGAFLHNFPTDHRFAIFYPLVFFTLWHVAIILIPGVNIQGGAKSLLGGAAIMGLIWGLLGWKTRSIYLSTLSHFGVNFFAFTGVMLANANT